MSVVIGCLAASVPNDRAEARVGHTPEPQPDLRQLLHDNDIASLDVYLTSLQKNFESGKATEVQLRDTYRAFYRLDPPSIQNLNQWVASKRTYVSLLARGTYLMKQGEEARGGNYVSDTSQDRLDAMENFFSRADADFVTSRSLTKKPYLTVYHQLNITMREAQPEESAKLIQAANQMLPNNALARDRYIGTLMPRWGGSYEQAQAFIERAKHERLAKINIMQLQALLEDDLGRTAESNGDEASKVRHYANALSIGVRVGGDFRKSFLDFANSWACSSEFPSPLCQP